MFPVFFTVVFILVIGGIIYAVASGMRQYAKNEASPVLTVTAKVVAKRTKVSHSHHIHDDMHSSASSSTAYYVTFQVESGDRMEFHVKGAEYGVLVEEDNGKLTFQGTRYLQFERF